MDEIFFFDTYAFFEIINGNPAYEKYMNCDGITTIFNIAELNYNLKKSKDKKIADSYTDKFSKFIVEANVEDIKNAMDIKSQKRSLSIPDAIGYAISLKHKVKFLTGDNDFENMSNVEFVK